MGWGMGLVETACQSPHVRYLDPQIALQEPPSCSPASRISAPPWLHQPCHVRLASMAALVETSHAGKHPAGRPSTHNAHLHNVSGRYDGRFKQSAVTGPEPASDAVERHGQRRLVPLSPPRLASRHAMRPCGSTFCLVRLGEPMQNFLPGTALRKATWGLPREPRGHAWEERHGRLTASLEWMDGWMGGG